MKLREILENYNPHWFEEVKTEGILRDRYIEILKKHLSKKEVTLLTGLRRIGKTTILKQFISILQKEYGGSRILYLSLDHPMLQKYHLGDILKEFRKINELSRREKVYLFLDEILYFPNIFQWLKVLHDNEKIKIYGTSSSSLKLKDKMSFLTGRHNTLRIKPLSFSEFLKFKGKDTHEPHLLEKYFEDYIKEGGIPQYVLTGDVEYLVELADDILMRDITAKKNIHNPIKLKELFLLLVNRIGKPFTYTKLSKLLSMKEETIEQYISYLASSELVHVVYKWSRSVNERIYAPKKIYLGDVGFRYALTGKYSTGSNLENILFLEILEKEPYYYVDKDVEIDFITSGKEIFECKLSGNITDDQRKILEKFKKRGYKVYLIDGYRYFI